MRIVFLGAPRFAQIILEALLASDCEVAAVVTQPDRPAGRKMQLTAPPVKETALKHRIPCLQPEKLNRRETLEEISAFMPEALIVAAYGKILGRRALNLAPFGAINLHASILPRWRGAAPIQYALIEGERETGVSIMKMEEGLDTGAVYLVKRTAINAEDTYETLEQTLAEIGGAALVEFLPLLKEGKIRPRPQPHDGISYAPTIKKSDGLINFGESAAKICRKARAFTPWPSIFSTLRGEHVKFVEVSYIPDSVNAGEAGIIIHADEKGIYIKCGEGTLIVKKLQLAGKRAVTAQEFLIGRPLSPGEFFGK